MSAHLNQQRFTDGAAHTIDATQVQRLATSGESDDVTNTRSQPSIQPASAMVVTLDFTDEGSAAATYLYLTFNAASDAEAQSKLATLSNVERVTIGSGEQSFVFPSGAECTRIDWRTDIAETGSNKVFWRYA